MKIRSLNYHSVHSFCINGYKREVFRTGSCFSQIYARANGNEHNNGYVDIFIADGYVENNRNRDHLNLLTKHELNQYLKWIKELTGLRMRRRHNNSYNSVSGQSIKTYFTDSSTMMVKLAPALVRNIYEFPFNISTKLAFIIGRDKDFKHLSFSERYCLANNICIGVRDCHTVFNPAYKVEMSKMNELQERIKSIEKVSDFMISTDDAKNQFRVWNDEVKHLECYKKIANGELSDKIKTFLLSINE